MTVAAAVAATIVLAALAVLQGLVAAGRPYGRLVWGGQHRVLPRRLRIGSVVAIGLYAAFAGIVLARTALFGPPTTFVRIMSWILLAYFVLGIILNALSRSFAERAVMTPVCVVLSACTLVVALD